MHSRGTSHLPFYCDANAPIRMNILILRFQYLGSGYIYSLIKSLANYSIFAASAFEILFVIIQLFYVLSGMYLFWSIINQLTEMAMNVFTSVFEVSRKFLKACEGEQMLSGY